jgi:membrane protein DedA with SNARE-associated domain
VDELRQWMEGLEGPLGYLVLAVSSWIEYVVPPFPGDTVALFGVFLAATAGYSAVWVYISLTLGSIIGGVAAWGFGRWAAGRHDRWPGFLRRPSIERGLEKVQRGFERRGNWYLAANRFVPALRAFFFVGAGLSNMSLGAVVLWGGLSAAAWNGLLLGAGFAIGENLDELEQLYRDYTRVVFGALGVALLAYVVWRWWSKRREAKRREAEPD